MVYNSGVQMEQIKAKMAKRLPEVSILAIAFIVAGYILWTGNDWRGNAKYTDIATFIVLAITLAALVYYARDTHRIANLTEKKWMLESQPMVQCFIFRDPTQSDSDKMRVLINNPSNSVLSGWVRCYFRIYGNPVECPDDGFNGKRTWTFHPRHPFSTYLEIGPILEANGYSMERMRSENKPNNRDKQLTLNWEIELKDELGQRRQLPLSDYFFDFTRGYWILKLTH